MVIETVFSDHVVNASELRSNQKHWLEEALKKPVTVNYSHRLLAILSREQVRDLFIRARYAELALLACRDIEKGRAIEELPWLEYLDQEERKQFRDELVDSFMKSSKTGNWDQMGELIADWKATSDTKRNPEVLEALKEAESPSEYVAVEE